MAARGDPRPPGHDTHHIVANDDFRAQVARDILEEAGINPRVDPDNGIHLPRSSMSPDTRQEAFTRHQTVHSDVYYRELTLRLLEAKREGKPGGQKFADFLLAEGDNFDWMTDDELEVLVEAAGRRQRPGR